MTMPDPSLRGMRRLLAVMRRLRDPEQGCPWDREQDSRSLARYTLEEACEVIAAIEAGDDAALRDELGDLLFQVVFHAQIASEQGRYDFDAIADGMAAKLERRHPHVFGEGDAAGKDAARWEELKAHERAARGATGVLDDVPHTLPALARAAKLGKRAARIGFDWADADGARAKVVEELAEIDAARRGEGVLEDEVGDLLLAASSFARHLGVDPETALRRANRRFEARFAAMEALAGRRGLVLDELDAAGLDALWNDVKRGIQS